VAEVFSGFVVGYAFSLLFAGVAAVMLIEARGRVPYLAKAIAPNIGAVQLAVPISILAFLAWTLVGSSASRTVPLGSTWRAAVWAAPTGPSLWPS
jgi:hypothetical protein